MKTTITIEKDFKKEIYYSKDYVDSLEKTIDNAITCINRIKCKKEICFEDLEKVFDILCGVEDENNNN